MISPTEFIDCDNLPEAMRGQFDKPWHFMGVLPDNTPYAKCLCKSRKCNKPAIFWRVDDIVSKDWCKIIHLQGYEFITDDMIQVIVFFGVCDKCGTPHWAHSGPPFKRARAYVNA